MATAYEALVVHPRLPELWPEYLVMQHAIIRATVPLTEAALTRSRDLADTDPLGPPLSTYLAEHVEEELDHDETLLDDLELLGIDRATVAARMPTPTVAALVGSQYYWILHYHPVSFPRLRRGDGGAPTPELIETLIVKTGYPREAFRTYIEHGELDPGHRDHLDRTVDSLPLAAWHESALGVSAISTAALAARGLEELVEG
jgi:hypothetical protein